MLFIELALAVEGYHGTELVFDHKLLGRRMLDGLDPTVLSSKEVEIGERGSFCSQFFSKVKAKDFEDKHELNWLKFLPVDLLRQPLSQFTHILKPDSVIGQHQ